MKDLKQAIIDYFHKDAKAKKVYDQVATDQAFDDKTTKEALKYLGIIIKNEANNLAGYQATNYGSQADYDKLGQ